MAQAVKNLPAMQETRVLSLGQEDPLKKGMATHSSILAWRNSWAEEPGGLQPMGSQRVSVCRRSQSASVLYHGCFARAHPPNLTHPQPVTPQSPSSWWLLSLFILMLGNLGLPFPGLLLSRYNKTLKSQLVCWNFFLPAPIGNANEGLNYRQERFCSEAWVFRTIPRVIKREGENWAQETFLLFFQVSAKTAA